MRDSVLQQYSYLVPAIVVNCTQETELINQGARLPFLKNILARISMAMLCYYFNMRDIFCVFTLDIDVFLWRPGLHFLLLLQSYAGWWWPV